MNVDLIAHARTVVGPGPDVARVVESTPREVPGSWRTAGIVGIVLGIAALGYGLATETHRTMGVFLTCLVYFIGVSQGGVMFSVAQHASFGRWGRPFKRIAESFVAFLPIAYLLYIVFLLAGGLDIYEWTHEAMPPHKAIWLQPGFFVARQVVMLGLLMLLSLTFVRNSLRPDMGVVAEQIGSRAPKFWTMFTSGWKGRSAEVEESYQRNIRLSPPLIVLYVILFSLFAVDSVMSLSPHWSANMFPAWIAVSSFWVAMNWICIVSVLARRWLKIDHLTKATNYHDLGKLMFAFSIFWAYTSFAQILPIWYGNMPEETGYLMLRFFVQPWEPLALVVGACCFVIPFTVLLSRGIKKLPDSLIGVAIVIAIGVFLERFMLVMPTVWEKNTLPLGPVEIGVFVGFVSAFLTVVLSVLAKVPPVPVSDPFMNPNPSDVHLHPSHAHDAHGHGPAHGH
jgi:hypothetical protein